MSVGYRVDDVGDRFDGLMPRSIPVVDMSLDPHQRSGTWDANGTCVFLRDERCAIHSSGFKPDECRTAYACRRGDDPSPVAAWNTAVGRIVLDIWRRELANPAPAARARVQARRARA